MRAALPTAAEGDLNEDEERILEGVLATSPESVNPGLNPSRSGSILVCN